MRRVEEDRAEDVAGEVVVPEIMAREFGGSCDGLSLPLVLDRLRDDADVGDAGVFDGVHDGGEGAEGDAFVGADVDDALRTGGSGS